MLNASKYQFEGRPLLDIDFMYKADIKVSHAKNRILFPRSVYEIRVIEKVRIIASIIIVVTWH